MSYDLEILVVNQISSVSIPFSEKIEVLNEIDDKMVMRFEETWKFMSQTKGVWYSLVKNNNGVENAYLLCKSDFEIDTKELPIPYWIDDEEVTYHLTPLIIYEEFIDEFKRILEYLIEQSPSNMIMFLSRYQSKDCEIIQGSIPINRFIQDLNNNKILFNVSYIITKD